MSTENLEKAHETKEVNGELDEVPQEEAVSVNIILAAVNDHKDHPLVKAVLEKIRLILLERSEKLEDDHSLFKVLKVVKRKW